jgi:hypothetical protein
MGLYNTLDRSSSPSLPLNPLYIPLKTIARGSLLYFIEEYEVHQPFTFTLIS